MPKKCEECDYFHFDNSLDICPECGHAMKFTMLVPSSMQPEQHNPASRAEEWNHELANYEQLELPWCVRISQIGAGIGIYCFISRTVKNMFFGLCIVGSENPRMQQIVIGYLIFTLVFHAIGALVGGAVAGAWSVNWIPQGIGVGVGVFLSPIVMYLLFGPAAGVTLASFAIMICITTALSVLGAWLGHKIVRPSRYVIS